jgi:hypothetical protein
MLISRNKTKLRYIIGIINKVTSNMLITAEYLHLVKILDKLVAANQLTKDEKLVLLHKSGLIKLKDGVWKEPSGATLTFN